MQNTKMSKISLLAFLCVFLMSNVECRKLIEASYSREQSGASGMEECSTMFVEYQNFYLRGVTENSYSIWYENTTFEACKKLCCFAEDDCLSFSYLANLDVCFIMNITRSHDGVELKEAVGWKHFQKFHTLETTVAFIDETTTPYDPSNIKESTDQNKEGSRSLPNITPSVTTPLPTTALSEEAITKRATPLARGAIFDTTNTIADKITKENIIMKSETTDATLQSDATTDTITRSIALAERTNQQQTDASTTIPKSSTVSTTTTQPPTPNTTPPPTAPPTTTTTTKSSSTTLPLTVSQVPNTSPPSTSSQHAGVTNYTEESAAAKSQSSVIIDSSDRDDQSPNDPSNPQNSPSHVVTSHTDPEGPEKMIARPDNFNPLGGEGSGTDEYPTDKENPTTSLCPLKCENGGRCEVILLDAANALTSYRCLCMEDYAGPNCEHHMAKSTAGRNGPADYAIALICLAIIIVILFVTVLIAFYLNRHKTGKYRVKEERERWNRRRKRRGPQTFVNSPTGSLAASEGSVRSGSDRSTATLV